MAPPAPKLYDEGTTDPAPEFDFSTLAANQTSLDWEVDLWNEGAAVDTMTGVSVGIMESDDGGVTWYSGGEVTLGRMVHAEAYGVIDTGGVGIAPQTTTPKPVGSNARLILKPIPGDTARKLRFTINTPVGGFSSASKKIKAVVYYLESWMPLGDGIHEGGGRGTVLGLGDGDVSYIARGGRISSSGADSNVDVTASVEVYRGTRLDNLASAEAVAASSAGNARWVTLSLDFDGVVTQTASAEVTKPAPITDRVAAPAFEPVLGYVHRDDLTNIAPSDVVEAQDYGAFEAEWSASSLDVTIHEGRALVDNRLVWTDSPTEATLTANKTTLVYVLPTSGMELVEEGSFPSAGRAEPIWEFVTDGSGVTSASRIGRLVPALPLAATVVGNVPASKSITAATPAVPNGSTTGVIALDWIHEGSYRLRYYGIRRKLVKVDAHLSVSVGTGNTLVIASFAKNGTQVANSVAQAFVQNTAESVVVSLSYMLEMNFDDYLEPMVDVGSGTVDVTVDSYSMTITPVAGAEE